MIQAHPILFTKEALELRQIPLRLPQGWALVNRETGDSFDCEGRRCVRVPYLSRGAQEPA